MRVITPVAIASDTAFSRASTATYVGSDGLIQTAVVDEVRVDYDPETLEPVGILIEDQVTNLSIYSQQFDNAAWTKSGSSIVANFTTAPDGTMTADAIVENSANVSHFMAIAATVSLGVQYTLSIYVKAIANGRYLELGGFGLGSLSEAVNFDVFNGTVSLPSTLTFTKSATITPHGNGWYRCSFSFFPASVGGISVFISNSASDHAGTAYLGNGASGFYIWGAQLEVGESPSSYIPTVAATVTREADLLGDMVTSTVAEPDTGEAAWDAATNYSLGNEVIRQTTHKKYINILAGVDATLPEVDAALDEPTRWVEAGPTNRFAMFDTLRNTQTETTSPLSVVVVPGQRVNSIGILAMEAEDVTITVANGYDQIYTYTENLNTREVLNWYDYFFEPFSNTPAIVKFDLPPYTAGNITITLTSSTGTVKCGAVIVGNYTDIGRMEYGARISASNFSRIDREFDGTAVLVQRQTKPKVTGQLFFNKSQTNKILALKQTLNAVPTVWSGMDDDNTDAYFDGLLVLGIYKLFDVDIAYPENALLDLEIEEI
jgi:hypothetical protein